MEPLSSEEPLPLNITVSPCVTCWSGPASAIGGVLIFCLIKIAPSPPVNSMLLIGASRVPFVFNGL